MFASALAASAATGVSKKLPARSYQARRPSTSPRNDSSPAQASARRAARRLSSHSKAECSTSLTRCQRSGVITLTLAHLSIEPRLGRAPLAVSHVAGEAEDFRRLLDC